MVSSAEIMQLARILGKSDFFGCLSLVEQEDLRSLTPEQLEKVHELVDRNITKLIRTFVHEAMADDSIQTAADAERYLEKRFAFFGELLTEEQQQKIREGYRLLTGRWGAEPS